MKLILCWIFVFYFIHFGDGLKNCKVVNFKMSKVENPADIEWQTFKSTHKRQFKSLNEEGERKRNFFKTYELIKKHNAEFNAGKQSFSMGLNAFSDMTLAEFQHSNLGLQLDAGRKKLSESIKLEKLEEKSTKDVPNIPENFDCRQMGYVTAVKNQGKCGSCWAFAVTATVETAYLKSANKKAANTKVANTNTTNFSEQQLLDCVSKNFTCATGGDPVTAFKSLMGGAIANANIYPYTAEKYKKCQRKIKRENYKLTNYVGYYTDFGDASTSLSKRMVSDLAQRCALVMIIGVHSDAFMHYSGGIYLGDTLCNNPKYFPPNHAVTVIGYGIENGVKYWIIKNSWGLGWGDKGYMKILRGVNTCACENFCYYPMV